VRPVRIGESRGPGVIGGCSRVPPDFFRVAKSHQLMGDLCTLSIHHWAAGLCSREPPSPRTTGAANGSISTKKRGRVAGCQVVSPITSKTHPNGPRGSGWAE
jgi:hypothetical protein